MSFVYTYPVHDYLPLKCKPVGWRRGPFRPKHIIDFNGPLPDGYNVMNGGSFKGHCVVCGQAADIAPLSGAIQLIPNDEITQ
jgi:hypothetical protein